jgi:hypothetical protein
VRPSYHVYTYLKDFLEGPLIFRIWIPLTLFHIACRTHWNWSQGRKKNELMLDIHGSICTITTKMSGFRGILSKLRLLLSCLYGWRAIVRWHEQLVLQKFCSWIVFQVTIPDWSSVYSSTLWILDGAKALNLPRSGLQDVKFHLWCYFALYLYHTEISYPMLFFFNGISLIPSLELSSFDPKNQECLL